MIHLRWITSSLRASVIWGARQSGRHWLLPDLMLALSASRACCVHMGSRNPLYNFVFRASSNVQMIPSERDMLYGGRQLSPFHEFITRHLCRIALLGDTAVWLYASGNNLSSAAGAGMPESQGSFHPVASGVQHRGAAPARASVPGAALAAVPAHRLAVRPAAAGCASSCRPCR